MAVCFFLLGTVGTYLPVWYLSTVPNKKVSTIPTALLRHLRKWTDKVGTGTTYLPTFRVSTVPTAVGQKGRVW